MNGNGTAPVSVLHAVESLLGASMLIPEAADELASLQPRDFAQDTTLSKHGRLYDAIRRAHKRGGAFNYSVVADLLGEDGLKEVGGVEYLVHLVSDVPTSKDYPAYAQRIRDGRQRQDLRDALAKLSSAVAKDDDLGPVREQLTKLLDETAGAGKADTIRGRLLDDQALDDLPDPAPLIETVLARDSLAVLYGKPGNAKSFVAVDWALCVGTGTWWHGHAVHKGTVIYVVAEGGKGIKKRKRAWQQHQKHYGVTGVRWLPMAVNLLDQAWADALIDVLAAYQPVMVIIDTLSRTMPGGNENAPEVMSRWIDNADRLRQATGATIVVVAHTPKDGSSIRGHSSLEGAAETTIECVKNGMRVTLKNAKAKDDPAFEDVTLALLTTADSCVLEYSHRAMGVTADDPESEQALLTAARECCGSDGLTSTRLMEVSALPSSTFYRAKKALADRGALTNIGSPKRARWIPTPEPVE